MTVLGDDVGYTVDLEHMTRHADDHPQPRTVRCTQVYRREDGEWKVVLRKSRLTWRSDNTWCRQARVRFQTTRTQPNVRLSTRACPGAGQARHLYAVRTTTELLRSHRFG